jgi:alpha-ketoglutarate-dependent taurine dioxygenase
MEEISGLDRADAMALIEELAEWAGQDRFVHEHSWRPHDVVMWDNTWTMHLVMPYDNVNQRRRMHRTAIAGSEAVM